MYGWRMRIGLMVPASNTTIESELWRMVPSGVSVHTARMLLGKVNEEDLIKMEEHVETAARELANADVDIIAFGCTTGSLVKGKGYDEQISDKIASITGIPAVTTSTAVLDALHSLDVKKVGVVTPYIDELNKLEKAFLKANGINVVEIKGLELLDNIDIGKQEPYIPYKLVKSLTMAECDGFFISCTNFRSIEIIEMLEGEIKKPVISSNQATLAAILKKGGINLTAVSGYGSLFRRA
ncbi:MAG: maleate cis-trans isomerase [Firmicutes bacterium]|nr:maleate cis-trans isomerase [Bacillota bacterium]